MATQRAVNHRWFQDRMDELRDQLRGLSSNGRGAILEDPSIYPPPPYSLAEETLNVPEHEEHENETPAPVPITIRIDVSTNIIGHGNTIVIPSLSAGASSSNSESGVSQPDIEVPGTMPTSAQQKNRAKVTELTTAIISALHSSGVLDNGTNGSNRGSVEIDIKGGITIQGNKNVVCGSIAGRNGSGNIAQAGKEVDRFAHVIERKRRAVSEPVEIPRAKRFGSGQGRSRSA
ncbi:hypothetical protein DTO212C5_2962 [Paecilomyces variotii]|nr:hypothetical protein DTO212C5_2962 [Paecilomyces variotii]